LVDGNERDRIQGYDQLAGRKGTQDHWLATNDASNIDVGTRNTAAKQRIWSTDGDLEFKTNPDDQDETSAEFRGAAK
jgi:hypothetical protein